MTELLCYGFYAWLENSAYENGRGDYERSESVCVSVCGVIKQNMYERFHCSVVSWPRGEASYKQVCKSSMFKKNFY